ncbi:Acetamidase/Formamidase [Ramaria rubella]|nr:Acetamidase/Formamidase [Ramaria rubella]
MASIHSVKRAQSHLAWDNSIQPVITVNSGETVSFDCLDASNGQITATSTTSAIAEFIFAQLDQVNGPVYINGAAPGDTLQIDVLSVETADWGWTGLIPGFGLLADEYKDPELKIWKINREEGIAWFDEEKKTIRIPIVPFAGEMGVAPGEKGAFSTIPPYATGGNVDTKHLTAGSILYLPVQVPGALFSIGDGHAAQGDGEVCGTAIETPIKVSVRLTAIKNKPYVKTPHFHTALTPSVSYVPGEQYYTTTGIGSNMREATRDAVRAMINYLGVEYGLNRVEAYMLCSVAADLRLHEVVDMPNYVIGMMLPKSIFVSK